MEAGSERLKVPELIESSQLEAEDETKVEEGGPRLRRAGLQMTWVGQPLTQGAETL